MNDTTTPQITTTTPGDDEPLPAQIERVANEIATATRTATELRRDAQILEAQHTLEIQNEMTDAGKPRYSNEDARRAALTLRLSTDDQHHALTHRLAAADEERARLIARHERLRGEFKLEWIARLERANQSDNTNL